MVGAGCGGKGLGTKAGERKRGGPAHRPARGLAKYAARARAQFTVGLRASGYHAGAPGLPRVRKGDGGKSRWVITS
jgi:hypothetical protein